MRYIDYLTANNQTGDWEPQCKIDTGIAMTDPDITIRIKYKQKYPSRGWTFCDRIVGYAPTIDYQDEVGGTGGGFRLFGWSGGTFDCGGRWTNLGIVEQDTMYDLTFNTNYLFDNTDGTMLVTSAGGVVPTVVGTHIFIDVSWTEIYELTIQNNNGLLLDGKPAVDNNGNVGLWDSVSESLIYNPDLDMYDPNPVDCTDCNNWQECGYESYEDCQCQQYGECQQPDCTDCTNWEECGYESLEECQNTHKVNLLPSTMNRIHLQISGGGWPNERIYIGDIYVWDDDDNEMDSFLEVYVNNGHINYYDNDWDDDFGRYVVETHTDTELLIKFEPEERGWYIEFEQSFDNCEDWESRGYESYSDCDCQNNQICPPEPDCTDCNNWSECGYESYDDCRCQQYGECPEPPVPVVPHLKIVETLKDILEGMVSDTDCALQSWQYNRLSKANVRLDTKMPSPTALFVQIQDFKVEMTRFTKKELSHVLVTFLDKQTKLDDEGLNEDAIIANMSDLAIDFILRVKDEKSLKITNDVINLKSVFYQSDSNRTGVTVELDIETLPTCIMK